MIAVCRNLCSRWKEGVSALRRGLAMELLSRHFRFCEGCRTLVERTANGAVAPVAAIRSKPLNAAPDWPKASLKPVKGSWI
jgi:hypothetical protein